VLPNGAIREDKLLSEDPPLPLMNRATHEKLWVPVGKLTRAEPFEPSRHNIFRAGSRFFPSTANFSAGLKEVVRRCLFYNSEERIDLRNLYDYVESVFETAPPSVTQLKREHIEQLMMGVSLEDSIGRYISSSRLQDRP